MDIEPITRIAHMRHAQTLSQETIVLKENLRDSEILHDRVELRSLSSPKLFCGLSSIL
jgi:hypothetical protein